MCATLSKRSKADLTDGRSRVVSAGRPVTGRVDLGEPIEFIVGALRLHAEELGITGRRLDP